MREIVSFPQESGKIAQTPIEETEPEQSQSPASTFADSDHYLGLIFLSIFIFLFLGFLLLKRKSQEVRLSIFVSLFLGFLLAIYTSVQIATQSLVEGKREGELDRDKRELIANQNNEKITNDRKADTQKSEDKEHANKEEGEQNKKANVTETEEQIRSRNDSDRETESRINNSDSSVEREQENLANNNRSISRSSTSQSPNLEQVPEQQKNNELTRTQSQINQNNRSRSPSRVTPSRNLSSNVRTSLFRPLLKLGDRGFDVTLLQRILQELGYYTLDIDGEYGISTKLAVQNFQQQNNLLADGIVGFSTCNILRVKSTTIEINCATP